MVAVAQTRGIAPSLLVSPTEAVRTGPPPRHRRIVVSPSAAGLDTVVVPYNGRGLCNSLHATRHSGTEQSGRLLRCSCRLTVEERPHASTFALSARTRDPDPARGRRRLVPAGVRSAVAMTVASRRASLR